MSDYKGICLKIDNITFQNREQKFNRAVETLAEQLGVECLIKAKKFQAHKEELIPILKTIKEKYEKKLQLLTRGVVEGVVKHYGLAMKKASDDIKVMKIKGKAIYNPNTGRMLTVGEWKKMRSAIDGFMTGRAEEYGYQMASESAITGILDSMLQKQGKNIEQMKYGDVSSLLSDDLEAYLKKNHMSYDEYRMSLINVQRTADYCTDMSERVKKGIKDTFRLAASEKWQPWRLGQELFDDYADWNKDWDRILRTEANDAFTDCFLEREREMADEGEELYYIGRSQSTACPICLRDISNVVVKYVEQPLNSENIKDKYAKKAIWAGKSSVGHPNKESYAVITRHPHCACRWVRHFPKEEAV